MKKQITSGILPLFLALLYVGLAITGCRVDRDDPDPITPPNNTYPTSPSTVLPVATQTGAGTLGCKINGRVWTFWIPPFALTSEQDAFVTESTGSGVTNIRARIWSADTFVDQYRVYHSLSFSFANPDFNPITLENAGGGGSMSENEFRFSLLINKQSKWYFPDTSYSIRNSKLSVDHIDTELNIISGHFDMVLYRGNNYTIVDRSDSLTITDGRFDFKYTQQ